MSPEASWLYEIFSGMCFQSAHFRFIYRHYSLKHKCITLIIHKFRNKISLCRVHPGKKKKKALTSAWRPIIKKGVKKLT